MTPSCYVSIRKEVAKESRRVSASRRLPNKQTQTGICFACSGIPVSSTDVGSIRLQTELCEQACVRACARAGEQTGL